MSPHAYIDYHKSSHWSYLIHTRSRCPPRRRADKWNLLETVNGCTVPKLFSKQTNNSHKSRKEWIFKIGKAKSQKIPGTRYHSFVLSRVEFLIKARARRSLARPRRISVYSASCTFILGVARRGYSRRPSGEETEARAGRAIYRAIVARAPWRNSNDWLIREGG